MKKSVDFKVSKNLGKYRKIVLDQNNYVGNSSNAIKTFSCFIQLFWQFNKIIFSSVSNSLLNF